MMTNVSNLGKILSFFEMAERFPARSHIGSTSVEVCQFLNKSNHRISIYIVRKIVNELLKQQTIECLNPRNFRYFRYRLKKTNIITG